MTPAKHTKIEHFTHHSAKWIGTSTGLVVAIFTIFMWLLAGGIFRFSFAWENAFTIYISIITFLLIFIMQRSQRKELVALHVKLNELIAVTRHADNNLIVAEDMTEGELQEVHETHRQIVHGKNE